MSDNVKRLVWSALGGIGSAIAGFFLNSSPQNWEKVLSGALWFAVAFVALLLLLYVPRALKAARKKIGCAFAGLLVEGLAAYIAKRQEKPDDPELLTVFGWLKINSPATLNWLSDQLLVHQNRYAFSITCIVFRREHSGLRVLVLRREFTGFEREVYLPPGGRFHGADAKSDLFEEIRRKVKEETGYGITIVPAPSPDSLESIDGKGEVLWNKLYPPPLFVMQQNRLQSHLVPGHVDLIYVAETTEMTPPSGNATWLPVEDVQRNDLFRKEELWPDTRECVSRARVFYDKHRQARVASGVPA